MTKDEGSKCLQYFAAIAGNLCAMAAGSTLTWTSPVLPNLERDPPIDDNPLGRPIDDTEASWIGSLNALGAVLGSIFAGYAAERWGRKMTLLGSVIPSLISWALIATSTDIAQIYVSRFISGLAIATVFTVLPMYIGEIVETSIRGTLGSFFQIFITIGMLWSYSIGPYVSYMGLWIACGVLPPLFFAAFITMPESPYWLLSKERHDDAINALARFRGKSKDAVQRECQEMKVAVEEAYRSNATWFDLYNVKANFKALLYTCALVTGQQLSGINVVSVYSEIIFQQASSGEDGLTTSQSTIVVGLVQVVASCVTPFVVDRLGRRILLVISGVGEVGSLAALGYFFYLQKLATKNTDDALLLESVRSWLPVLSLIVLVASYSIGWGPVPWAIMGEMFASDVKGKASSITVFICWSLGFLISKFYSDIADYFGNYTAFWLFAGFSGIAVLFAIFILPETKGKSLEEIQAILGGHGGDSIARIDQKDLDRKI